MFPLHGHGPLRGRGNLAGGSWRRGDQNCRSSARGLILAPIWDAARRDGVAAQKNFVLYEAAIFSYSTSLTKFLQEWISFTSAVRHSPRLVFCATCATSEPGTRFPAQSRLATEDRCNCRDQSREAVGQDGAGVMQSFANGGKSAAARATLLGAEAADSDSPTMRTLEARGLLDLDTDAARIVADATTGTSRAGPLKT